MKDSLGNDDPKRDNAEFTDSRCEKVNVDEVSPPHFQSFLTSNTTHLHSLLQHYNGSVVETVLHVFVHNNSHHTMNNYELSLFLRTLFVKLPNDILPYIDYDDVLSLVLSPSDYRHEQTTDHQPSHLRHPRPPPHLPRETLSSSGGNASRGRGRNAPEPRFHELFRRFPVDSADARETPRATPHFVATSVSGQVGFIAKYVAATLLQPSSHVIFSAVC